MSISKSNWLVAGTIVLATALSATANATPEFWGQYQKLQTMEPRSVMLTAECKNCHTSPPRRNPYGKQIEKAMESAGKKEITSDLLRQISSLDSDGDGSTNEQEWKSDTLPGDPLSKPVAGSQGNPPTGSSPGDTGNALLPKHAFHPAVVHFPIALFIIGVAVDVFGFRKRDETIRKFGYWNMSIGLGFSILAVITGLLARSFNNFAWNEPAFLTHFVASVSATILMLASILLRRSHHRESWFYFAVAVVAALVVGAAGHFGAAMVYG